MSFELAPYTFTQFFVEKSRAKCFLCFRVSSLQAPPACTCYTIRSRGKLGKEFRQIIVQASNNYREKQYKLRALCIGQSPSRGHYTQKLRVEFAVIMGMPAVAFFMLMHQLACWLGSYVPTARLQMNNHHTWCRELILWLSFKNRPGANCDPRLECHSLRILPDHKKTLRSFSCDWRMDLSTCKYSEDKAPIPWS